MADRRISFILGANIKNFTKGLDKAQRRFQSFGNTMQSVGKNLTTKLTLPIIGAGAVAIKTAAQYETLRQSMDILNGSAAEGARNFERLKRFSARTPFQLQDLASAQNMLQGFGQTADDAFESLSMIGDIAAVSGGDIKGIGIAFGQAAAEGRVMTRDIRQFINQGVPMIKMLSETMGVAQSDILDLASEGKISFEILQQAFREATSEGGMFADGMAKQSRTISGLFSTLKDNVSIALGEIGDELTKTLNLKELMSDLIEQIQVGVEWFKNLSDQAKRLGIAIAGILAVVGPTLLVLGKLVTVIAALVSPAFLATAAITALFAGVVVTGQWFVDNWKMISLTISAVTQSVVIAFQKMGKGVMIALREVVQFMLKRVPPVFMAELFGIDVSGWATELVGIDGAISGLTDTIEQGQKDLTDTIKKAAEIDLTSFSESAKNALELTKNAIINGLQGILSSSQIQDLLAQLESFFTPTGGGESDAGDGLTLAQKRIAEFGEGIKSISKDSRRSIDELADTVMKKTAVMQKGIEGFGSAVEIALDGVNIKWLEFKHAFQEIGGEFKAFLAQEMSQAVLQFARTLGESLSGAENQWKTTFEKIIIVVLDFAESLARLVAGIGAVMMFIPGFQGQAAGLLAAAAALQAITSGFKMGIEKRASNRQRRDQDIPRMASGGIVPAGFPNDTYPALLSSGETVVPAPKPLPSGGFGGLNIHVTGELRGNGKEIVGVIKETTYKMDR